MNDSACIEKFIADFNDLPNDYDWPNWISVHWYCEGQYYGKAAFDFKNDLARKSFGALCHKLYTSTKEWQITTKRI